MRFFLRAVLHSAEDDGRNEYLMEEHTVTDMLQLLAPANLHPCTACSSLFGGLFTAATADEVGRAPIKTN